MNALKQQGVIIGPAITPGDGCNVGESRAVAVAQLTPEQAALYLQVAHMGDYDAGYLHGYRSGARCAELSLAEMWRAIDAARLAHDERTREPKGLAK